MGAPGSPYSRKIRAVLRYRRMPYHFILANSAEAAAPPKAQVPLLPTFYLPDASGEIVPLTDSAPLIRRLETDAGLAPEARGLVDASLAGTGCEVLFA